MTHLLEPGVNCWRIERAERAAFLIDGADYFRAVYDAISQARHSVLLLGWDIDSRVYLVTDDEVEKFPPRLGDFLNAVVSRRGGPQAYVLVWDFAMIYAFEREWLPAYKLGWQTHRRLHFRMDNRHPAGASHHQKVIVVDDAVAFVGGFDLSKWRWDHPAHIWQDPGRLDADRRPYPPFHDLQMVVSGDAAAALGDLARERWYRYTGERVAPPPRPTRPLWPHRVTPDLEDVPVAIARTEPRYDGQPGVHEVARLFVDTIRAARDFIYVENQYYTSRLITEVLGESLRQRKGPEMVLVLPMKTSGWMEQYTMDVLRGRILRSLREADRHHRLRIYYPQLPADPPAFLNVHSKVMIADDLFARVGSANLSNRSMGFDTECDLFIESGSDRTREAIALLRSRLMAEHLGSTPTIVEETLAREGSLIAAMEAMRAGARTLQPLDGTVPAEIDAWIPDAELIDPEGPLKAEALVDRLVDKQERRPVSGRLLRNLGILIGLLLLAAAWRWTPLREWLDLEAIQQAMRVLEQSPFAPLMVTLVFVLLGLVAIPVTLLIIVTILTFGPVLGFIYSMVGAMLSAFVTYGIGLHLGRDLVRRFAGETVNRLSRRLARRGVLTIVAIRLIPVAPFSVVNVVAGASHIQFRDFALGTALGMLPGILAITLFVEQLTATATSPNPGSLLSLAGVLAAIGAAVLAIRHWLIRREKGSDKASSKEI